MLAIIGKIFIFLLCAFYAHADTLNISHRTSPQQNPKNHPVVELTLAKQQFFVGEYVPFKLRVTYDAHVYDVQNLVQPQGVPIIIKEISKPKKWKDTVTDAWITEWEGTLYATQEGRFSCGPFQLLMQQRMSHGMSSWAFFTTQHTVAIESNSIGCRALPFPVAPDRALHPIGHFTAAHLEVDQHDFKAGQAVTLRMQVVGTGHVPPEAHPRLELPEGLKWYLATVHQDQDGVSFEYVIQALHDAIFVIPGQKYIFFDPETQKYKTLTTESIRLFVEPNPHAQQQIIETEEQLENVVVPEADQQAEVLDEQPSRIRQWYIPDAAIFWALLMVLIVACGVRMRKYFSMMLQKLHRAWTYKQLIRAARKKARFLSVHTLQKREEMLYLYEIFKKLETAVDWEQLQTLEQEKATYEQWKTFWCQLEHIRFAYNEEPDKNFCGDCARQALQWLSFFEKKII